MNFEHPGKTCSFLERNSFSNPEKYASKYILNKCFTIAILLILIWNKQPQLHKKHEQIDNHICYLE
jgi:hypothetical protein